MTKKLPDEAKVTERVKKDIEQSLTLADTLNGKKPLGGTLGKKLQNKLVDTTNDFEQFLKDIDYLIKGYSTSGSQTLGC
ncbi:hypothetical protein [Brunnivagina elsteri]|uniref:Uncharacterized protein n=1 Tax=Brunnivagina elsteri CCALA 953 TaxID=987040 RepID=A0A2A2TEE0_9CYAN|nr:hypothetical protein [Calothrix elsteri]PAX52016.1 hypothetical protein CK510_21675 [Calothrix elsteri CCALA 953]